MTRYSNPMLQEPKHRNSAVACSSGQRFYSCQFDTDFCKFFRAYIDAALWSSNDESDESGGDPMDRNYDAWDIADETLDEMAVDCWHFLCAPTTASGNTLTDARRTIEIIDYAYMDCAFELGISGGHDAWQQAGHDLWLTRNGHGCGFWEDEWTAVYDKAKILNSAARDLGYYGLYIGGEETDADGETVRRVYGSGFMSHPLLKA